ncbi:MAG TPA: hypothetical protein VMV46_00360, partial [Thermoanaerobaculia bacterium]|nr:hypothetical protein [Thermoanaerobaculia bacterium]
LVEADPARSEWWMTRWALSATLGDLAAPLVLAAVAFCGGAGRQAVVVSGALTALYAAAVARRPFPAPLAAPSSEAQPPAPSTWRVVAAAAGNRRLLGWLSGVFLCSFLDELLLALGALHLADNLGLGAAARAGVLAAFPIGAVGGLAVCERLLARAPPRSVLAGSAACCTAAYLGWLAAPSAIWSGVLLALVGASAAPLYPIAKAQAYRALPGRPGAVNALGQLFTPAEVALPFLLGVLADRCGLLAALLVLVLQPVGILALALLSTRPSALAETSR